MGKSNVRILPPLVHGKLTTIVELSVDYLNITEKVVEDGYFNFLIQILWWGETKPSYLRPRKIQYLTQENEQIVIDDQIDHTAKYEIRTKPKLFRSYLSKCDRVELGVWDARKNEVIGSAFLEDLVYLVYDTHFFTNPIINESGDQIGEITCHFVVNEVNEKDEKDADILNENNNIIKKKDNCSLKINLNLTEIYSPKDKSKINKAAKGNKGTEEAYDYIGNEDDNENRNVMHYNSPAAEHSHMKNHNSHLSNDKCKSKCLVSKNDCVTRQKQVEAKKCIFTNSADDSKQTENDSSKVLIVKKIKKNCTPVLPKKLFIVNKKPEKNRSLGVKVSPRPVSKTKPDKINVDEVPVQKVNSKRTLKCLKKDKADTDNSRKGPKCNKTYNNIINTVVRPTGNIKSFSKVSNEISKLNELYLNMTKGAIINHADLEKIPVKELFTDCMKCPNCAGDNNRDSKPNVISSREQPNSDNSTENEGSKTKRSDVNDGANIKLEGKERVNVDNKLFFDLSDPVEKKYYETFFVKTERIGNNEFEIAELLNQPENKYVLEAFSQDKLHGDEPKDTKSIEETFAANEESVAAKIDCPKPEETVRENNPSDSSCKNSADSSCQQKNQHCTGCDVNPPKDFDSKPTNQKDFQQGCHRCKYYKKLKELDRMVATLKYLETKFKEDFDQSFWDDDPDAPCKNAHVHKLTDESDQGDCVLGNATNESDFSKDDSDFIEFTNYLSRR